MTVSDDFSDGVLDPVWSIEGPAGTSANLATDATDAFLELVTADGNHDVWNTNNGARAMQAIGDTDFQIETRFLTTPTEKYQLQGLLVEQDADNWLRFDTYSDGNRLYAFAAITVNGTSSMGFRVQIPQGTAPYLRLDRTGDTWTMEYSIDGSNWTTAGSFTHALTVTSAGVVAGNSGQATGFTAQVDYFENTADPIADEDGTIVPVNNAPTAGDDALATDQDMALSVNVAADLLGNDSDPDGDALSFDGFTQPANGTLTDNGDGTLSYTPDPGYNGVDTFTYTVSDGTFTDTATVSITVSSTTPVNNAPTAGDDALATDQDMALSVNVAADLLGNDSDPDGDALSFDGFTQPANGTLTDNGDGTLSYTPDAGYNGVDTFTYTVSDGTLTDTATVSITVNSTEPPPPASDAVSDDFSAKSVLPSSIVLTNGSGGGSGGSNELSFAGTNRAVVVDLSAGTYAYAAKIMPSGDSLTVGVVDGSGAIENLEGFRLDLLESVISAGGWINYVGGANNGPVDMLDTDNAAVSGMTVRIAAGEGQAGAADVSEAAAAYKPDIGLMMLGTNDILDAGNFPILENGTDALSAIMTKYQSLVEQFFANADPGAHLIVSTIAPRVDRGREAIASEYFNKGYSIVGGEVVVGDAGNGSYQPGLISTIAEMQGTYSSLILFDNPHADFAVAGDADSLDHLSIDGLHWTQDAYAEYSDALYTLLETEIGMSAGTLGGAAQTIAPNVTEVYGSEFADRITGDANDNIINGGAGSNLLEGGAGADSFILDGSALQTGSFNRIADFNFAEGDIIDVSAISAQFGLSDAQAQAAYSFVGTQAGVQLMLTHGGTTYHLATLLGLSLGDIGLIDPAWRIEGPSGTSAVSGTNSSNAWLSLVTPDGNHDVWNTNNGARAMQAIGDTDFQIETRFLTTPTEKYQLQGLLVEQDADNWLRFDTYSDGNRLYAFAAITVNGTSSMGFRVQIPQGTAPYLRLDRTGDTWTMEYSIDGSNWTTAGSFTHALTVASAGVVAGNSGQATGFTAQVDYFENTADPIADEDGTIVPVNNAPTAGDDALATDQDMALSVNVATDLLGNDSDPDGDALSFDGFTQPANGTLTDNGDGTLSYTPDAGYNGVDTFTYTVSDGTFTDTATVSITVSSTTPVNNAPTAGDDALATDQDMALSVNVAADLLGNDSDPDGDALSFDGFTQPANGTLTDNGDGTLSYTPDPGYNGVDTFTYTVSDGTLTDTATVNITVNSTEPPPPASDAVSDDFSNGVLSPVWRVEGPAGTSANLATDATDAFLELVTADGNHDVWNVNNGARAMQDITDGDFEIATRFLSTPTQKYQLQGLIVEQDDDNWIRFDTYSDGNKLRAFVAVTTDGSSSGELSTVIPGGVAPYLRVTRAGDTWTMEYSTDGSNWTAAGSFNHAMTVASVGVFAGNTGQATGFTAQVDYFENTADPIADEDGTIVPVNNAPTAADDAFATDQDMALSVNVATDLLGNDSDPDGDALSFDGFTQPANGTLTDNGDGTLSYTPDAGYNGVDTFTYTVSDGTFTDTATVSITVSSTTPVNNAPTAGDDALATDQDMALSVNVAADLLGNDSDPDGDALSFDGFTQPANGTLTDNGDGTLSYTPDPGYNGVDTFTYTVSDGTLTDTATVNITVNSTEPPPPASDAVSDDFSNGVLSPVWRVEGPAGTSANLATDATDAFLELVTADGNHDVWNVNNGARAMQDITDGDFEIATRFLSTPTQKYQLQGLIVEQDDDNWIRFDTYSDGNKLRAFVAVTTDGSSSGELSTVIPGGVAPYLRVTRAGDTWTMEYSTDGSNWTAAGSFNHAMTVASVGVFAGNTGQATGFTAQVDYFENTADPIADEDGTIVPVNNAPTAADDAFATDQDMALSVNVATDLLGNDSDPDGDALSFDGFTQPANGTLTDNGDGTLSYTPDAGYNGVDTFTYTVSDGTFTDTATVSITVSSTTPVNNAPTAGDDALATDQDMALSVNVAADLLGNDSDPDGDALSFDGFTQPANGTLTDNGDGTLSYTPDPGYNGVDTFTYTVSDGTLTDTATVSITVNSTEPPPPASDAVSDDFSNGVLSPVWRVEGPAGTSANLATDATDAFLELVTADGNHDVWNVNNGARAMQDITDGDFEIATRFLSTPTQKYQLQGLIVEQDDDNWIRFDTYSDGNKLRAFVAVTTDGSSSGELSTVIPGGVAPYLRVTRAGDTWTMEYSTDGSNWTAAGSFNHAMTVASVGVFAGNTGQATGFTAQVDYFENTADPIADEDGTIVPVNNAPTAADDAFATDQDMALSVNVAADLLGNDSDTNGDALSFDDFTQPANGTLTDNGDGTLSYTPDAGYNGVDTFTYTVSDGTFTDTATVSITVGNPINVWYGLQQYFGSLGEAQEWINILGNVAGDVISLTYSLNGGAARNLSVGADTRRLQNEGDFNIDLAYSELDGSDADDIITISAQLASGEIATRDVVVEYETGAVWDANYSIDWSTVNNIQDVAQIVDGTWDVVDGGLRPVDLGYDRLVVVGDQSWDNYELSMTVTTHDLLNMDPNGRDGGGFAIGMLWDGHTDTPIQNFQPKSGWEPGAAFFYTDSNSDGVGKFQLHPSKNFFSTLDSQSYALEEGATYELRVRVEQTGLYDRTYSMKVWEEGESEPTGWTLQGTQAFSIEEAPATGSIYLNAHYFDVAFNNLSVTEITGSDIVQGTIGNDLLSAVNTEDAQPGFNEIDVFVGNEGADVFVFGDTNGAYYNDGIGNNSGRADYGFVWDFTPGADKIQLAGSAEDYVLAEDTVDLAAGTSIWLAGSGGAEDELIGLLNGVYGFNLEDEHFIYTDTLIG